MAVAAFLTWFYFGSASTPTTITQIPRVQEARIPASVPASVNNRERTTATRVTGSIRGSDEYLSARASLRKYFGDTETALAILDFALLHARGAEENELEKRTTQNLLHQVLSDPESALEIMDRALDSLSATHAREREGVLHLTGYLAEESKSVERAKLIFEKELRRPATAQDTRERQIPSSAPVYALTRLLQLDATEKSRQAYLRSALQEQTDPKVREEIRKTASVYSRGSEFDGLLK